MRFGGLGVEELGKRQAIRSNERVHQETKQGHPSAPVVGVDCPTGGDALRRDGFAVVMVVELVIVVVWW